MRETNHFKEVSDPMMKCPCCNEGGLSIGLLILLEHLRERTNSTIQIVSGARCTKHNKKVGGANKSEHLIDEITGECDGVDIKVKDLTPTQVVQLLKELPYANLLGIGKYKTWVHVDIRGYPARW